MTAEKGLMNEHLGEVTKPLIFGQMIKIMADVEPIAKDRQNVQQNYKFRGIDDVYAALQGIMARHGVFTLPTVVEDRTEERTTKSGSALIYRILKIMYEFYATDASSVKCYVIGEGMDSGDKASNKAMSVAHKYALLQAFCIPTEDSKDPENDSQDLKPKNNVPPPKERVDWSTPTTPKPYKGNRDALLTDKQQKFLYAKSKACNFDFHDYMKKVFSIDSIKELNGNHLDAMLSSMEELKEEVPFAPQVELYQGLDKQKPVLAAILQLRGITDPNEMREISMAVNGTDMQKLADRVDMYLKTPL
jgi:hypothetical protein